MDYRSFALNFEVNAFIYDEEIAKEIRVAYEDDIKKSKLLTLEIAEPTLQISSSIIITLEWINPF
jgi:phosphatidylserine/phosphatidylglycerophosphate/cardiolipin synthase-like enzyme